jgi:hypothetical protein
MGLPWLQGTFWECSGEDLLNLTDFVDIFLEKRAVQTCKIYLLSPIPRVFPT